MSTSERHSSIPVIHENKPKWLRLWLYYTHNLLQILWQRPQILCIDIPWLDPQINHEIQREKSSGLRGKPKIANCFLFMLLLLSCWAIWIHYHISGKTLRSLYGPLIICILLVDILCVCVCVHIDAWILIFCLQDVNRGGSRHKLLQDFRYEEGDSMVHDESGESSVSSIPFQVHLKCQFIGSLHLKLFNYLVSVNWEQVFSLPSWSKNCLMKHFCFFWKNLENVGHDH